MTDNVLGRRLEIVLAKQRCNICFNNFRSGVILSDRISILQYSNKRFFSTQSRPEHKKPILGNFSAPLIKRHSKKPKTIFLRNTFTTPSSRKIGNIVVVLLMCDSCGSERQIDINIDNINNSCSK